MHVVLLPLFSRRVTFSEPDPLSTFVLHDLHLPGDHLWQASGKFIVLDKLLNSLKRRGRRVLIFSTSVQSLDVLQDFLAFRGHE